MRLEAHCLEAVDDYRAGGGIALHMGEELWLRSRRERRDGGACQRPGRRGRQRGDDQGGWDGGDQGGDQGDDQGGTRARRPRWGRPRKAYAERRWVWRSDQKQSEAIRSDQKQSETNVRCETVGAETFIFWLRASTTLSR